MEAIDEFHDERGERTPDGRLMINVEEVVMAFAECFADIVIRLPSGEEQEGSIRDMHMAVDAFIVGKRSGDNAVTLNFGTPISVN